MKKFLITMLTAMLALMMLSGCGAKDTPEEVPDDVNSGEVEVINDDIETEEKEQPDVKECILKEDMKVRKGPSTDSEWIKTSELAEDDKDKALEGDNAVLKKGSKVKCLEEDGYWIRTESGWICGYEKGRDYVVDAAIADRMEEQMDRFFEEVGVDRDDSEKLSGTYKINSGDSEDSVEFFEDGECAVHFDHPMTPVTDEDGYTNGYYAVSGSKVYINCGGSVYADVYEMSGKTLKKTSEQIEVFHG